MKKADVIALVIILILMVIFFIIDKVRITIL